MKNINFKGVGLYHPQKKVGNDYFLNHYDKQDIDVDVKELLKISGRKYRYLSDDKNENCITMATKACKEALEKANLSGKDIDVLVFSSGTPEYLAPSNAIMVHREIGGKSSAIVYDINANCVGMILAIEQVSNYLASNKNAKYAMVVGSEQMNKYCQDSDVRTKCNFGDLACAVILEKVDGDSGFIDAIYHTNSDYADVMLFPSCGMSNIYNPDISEHDKRIQWKGTDGGGFNLAHFLIQNLLDRNNLSKDSISKYFLCQMRYKFIEEIAKACEDDINKFVFVGDKYGYTGTCSPFMALYSAIENGMIKPGDYIVFWTIGTGYVSAAMIWKY